MSDAAMTKAYEQLTPHERFRLTIEAMARQDWREADRLEDACPRHMYRCEDVEFRDRMRRVHLYTLFHALEVEGPAAELRLVEAIAELADVFTKPVLSLAEVSFRAGREHGLWEARASLKPKVAAAELADALCELREAVAEGTSEFARRLADGVRQGLGRDVAAKREGFARFCRETLGVEAETLLEALQLPTGCGGVEADAGEVDAHAAEWTGRWRRRFANGGAV